MSGSDHMAGKGIVPSALMYRDVSPLKHHHGGPKAGPGDTYQESFVDWLWARPWVSGGCSYTVVLMQGLTLIARFSSQGWRVIQAGRGSAHWVWILGRKGLHRGSPGCLLLKLPPLQRIGFVPHSPPVQSSGRAPGKLHGTVLLGKSIGTENSTWI